MSHAAGATEDRGIARASAVMAGGTLVSRLLGFARAVLLVALLGTVAGDLAGNAFDVANKLPSTIYLLIAGGALNAVLVPAITKADGEGQQGKVLVDRLVTLTLTVMLVLTVVLTVAAVPVVALYVAPGWPAEQTALAVAFAVWTMPQIFFYGTYALFGQLLNARQSFGPYTWAPVANNVVAIASLVAILGVTGPLTGRAPQHFGPGLVAAIAGTATLGVVVQALVLIPPLRRAGFSFRPSWRWRGVGLRSAGVVAGWTFGALLCTQLATIVLSRITTGAGEAAVRAGVGNSSAANAAWTNAFLLFILPHSLIAVSVVTARFTGLSKAAAAGELAAVGRDTIASARSLVVLMTLAGAGFVALGQPIAVLLFGHGAERGAAIGAVLVAMAVGLPAFSATYLLQRLFYALRDGRTPFVVQAITSTTWVASMLVIAAVAAPARVVPAVALAMSVTQALAVVLLAGWAARRLPGLAVRSLAWTWLRATAAGAGAVTTVALVLWRMDAADGWLLPTVDGRATAAAVVGVGGLVGVVVFVLLARLLKVVEIADALTLLRRFAGVGRRRSLK